MPLSGGRPAYWRLRLQALVLLVLARRIAALRVFTSMLSRWPDDGYVLASRAHLHAQLGQRDLALADAQVLTRAHPQRNAADWFNLAYLLADAGHDADAERAFHRAVGLDPKLDRAWYGLGLLLIHAQRFDEAAAALKRNTELQPMSPYGWYQLARVQLDRGQPEEARQIVRHLKAFEPRVAAQLEHETGLAK
jgi:tetratricopeptide (TPR) repeat protein